MAVRRAQLRDLRKLMGLSGEAMAEAGGFTRQAYSQLEREVMMATPERMARLNRFLRCERNRQLKELRERIAVLESFDIDETLYLREEATP